MNLDKLHDDIRNCRLCEKQFGYTPHPVVRGKINSKIMHISQAPSMNVHKTLLSFNDASGKKLKYEWYQITDEEFYNQDNFYITSVGHCYPGKNKKGKDNSPPKICSELWLKKEIELVNCKLYVIVGSKAANFLFPNDSFEELVFKDNIFNGKKALVLPHPSPLNIKWFKDHPDFENKRIVEIRAIIKQVLFN
jgi:uracil-DNA glycosylase family 4